MTYDELKKFILEDMKPDKSLGEEKNYQPVMIRTINQNEDGKATKEEIIEQLQKANPSKKIDSRNFQTVCETLIDRHKVIKKEGNWYCIPDYDTYTPQNKAWITMYCDERISDNKDSEQSEKKIILFSVSGQASFDHFEDTILNDVNPSQFSQSEMKQFPRVRTWGSIPNKWALAKWSKLKKGDIILFYRDKQYVASAILEGTEQNRNAV